MSKEAIDELIAVLRGEKPPSEEERKEKLLNEGKDLVQRLVEYKLEVPQTRVSSGYYTGRTIGINTFGEPYESTYHTIISLGAIPLIDIERMVANTKKRVSKIERKINETLEKFSSETLEGKMEGKDNRQILADMRRSRILSLKSHFNFLIGAPSFLEFDRYYRIGSFELYMHAPPVTSVKIERINGTRSQVHNDIQFILEFEQINQDITERVRELKLSLEQWLKNIGGEVA